MAVVAPFIATNCAMIWCSFAECCTFEHFIIKMNYAPVSKASGAINSNCRVRLVSRSRDIRKSIFSVDRAAYYTQPRTDRCHRIRSVLATDSKQSAHNLTYKM